ncbi:MULTISPECIES: hypothetical protein [unclassified Chelatococcus]|uniref:hypothetical protein n=1 Tax=unclassified Chelatococcus TaxID=2638111 RepID=UPI001BCCC0D4|nr:MULTISPECIES: hypothetical protein [unclassified Chelatococcus]MBS7700651.1 hypothetical protein [Chelatococcus sp. YT9]MBX3559082.1 hypothetical protein [Chelatococcus sp.]
MATAAITTPTPLKRRLPLKEIARLSLGVVIIGGILFGQQAFGMITRDARVDPAIVREGLVDVLVVLNFEPERFHNERLARLGMFSGRDGSTRRVRLRQVTQDNLRALSSLPWIGALEPLK